MSVEAIQKIEQQLGFVSDRLKLGGIAAREFILLQERQIELEKRKKSAIIKLKKSVESEAESRIKLETVRAQTRCDDANAFSNEVIDQLEVIQNQLVAFEQLAEVLNKYPSLPTSNLVITGGSSSALNKETLVRAVLGSVFDALQIKPNQIKNVLPVGVQHFSKVPLELRTGLLKEFSCEVDEQGIKARIEQSLQPRGYRE